MLKRTSLPLLGLLLATLAGCASTDSKSTGGTPAYVEGTWMGGTSTGTSSYVVVLKQTGNKVTGTLSGGGPQVDGPIEGTVDSNSIRAEHSQWISRDSAAERELRADFRVAERGRRQPSPRHSLHRRRNVDG